MNKVPVNRHAATGVHALVCRSERRTLKRGLRTRRAFTLLELLVALFIVALIMAGLAASLRIAFRAKAGCEAAVAPVQRVDVVLSFLQRDMESALAPTGTLASAFQGIQGDGGNADVLFDAAADAPPQVAMQTDIRQIEYLVEADGDDHLLVRSVTSNLLAPITPNPDQEIICRGVQSFTVQYYDGSDWYDTWDSTTQQNALPVAVQITLDLDGTPPDKTPLHITRLIQLPCYVAPTTQPASAGGAK